MVSTATCFGTGVPSSGSLLKKGTQVQHVNPGTARAISVRIDALDLCSFVLLDSLKMAY